MLVAVQLTAEVTNHACQQSRSYPSKFGLND